MTETDHAQILYGTPTPAPAPAPAEPPAPFDADAAAAALYTDGTDNVDEVTGLDKVHAPTQRTIVEAGVTRLGVDPVEARQAADDWGATFREYGLDGQQANTLTGIALGVVAGGVEPDPIAWRSAARTALTQEFGTNADAALVDAQRLVAKDQKLHDWLAHTGLGDEPRFVLAIARRAKALRAAGKL